MKKAYEINGNLMIFESEEDFKKVISTNDKLVKLFKIVTQLKEGGFFEKNSTAKHYVRFIEDKEFSSKVTDLIGDTLVLSDEKDQTLVKLHQQAKSILPQYLHVFYDEPVDSESNFLAALLNMGQPEQEKIGLINSLHEHEFRSMPYEELIQEVYTHPLLAPVTRWDLVAFNYEDKKFIFGTKDGLMNAQSDFLSELEMTDYIEKVQTAFDDYRSSIFSRRNVHNFVSNIAQEQEYGQLINLRELVLSGAFVSESPQDKVLAGIDKRMDEIEASKSTESNRLALEAEKQKTNELLDAISKDVPKAFVGHEGDLIENCLSEGTVYSDLTSFIMGIILKDKFLEYMRANDDKYEEIDCSGIDKYSNCDYPF